MEDCIFCKIVAGEIPSHKIYEDENVYAFLSIGPLNAGHTLVVPKKHSRDALDMNADEFATLSSSVHTIARAVRNAVDADGINIIFNCGEAAGQEVFHTHAHIAPRLKDDGHKWWPHGTYSDGEAETIAARIKKVL